MDLCDYEILNGYGPLPFGGATGPISQNDNQHVVSLVGASPNLPIEVPATSYGDNFNTGEEGDGVDNILR